MCLQANTMPSMSFPISTIETAVPAMVSQTSVVVVAECKKVSSQNSQGRSRRRSGLKRMLRAPGLGLK
jgi:hypothetical protein